MRIFTIGYESVTVAEFLATLTDAGVQRLIDVRALPLSRRPGFSKTPLKAALAEVGIDYVHLRALGTPAAARAGRRDDLERIYAGHLELPEAVAQGAMMLELAAEKPSALLCFERNPAVCHRSLLLAAIAPDAPVEHLFAYRVSSNCIDTLAPTLTSPGATGGGGGRGGAPGLIIRLPVTTICSTG